MDNNEALRRFEAQFGQMVTAEYTTCKWCGEWYEKVLPGDNVCGTCQVVWAIKTMWIANLYQRWYVSYWKMHTDDDGNITFTRRRCVPCEAKGESFDGA